jgi:hypothetical protein
MLSDVADGFARTTQVEGSGMLQRRTGLFVAAGSGVAVLAFAAWPLGAQTNGGAPRGNAPSETRALTAKPDRTARPASISVELGRPFSFPFRKDTPLEFVVEHLRKSLDAPVVLDVAALARLGIGPEATVRLELDGVRLETGLKLLLDQVGMTYRVIPEDNLLILTDHKDGDDGLSQALAEIKVLHRELHDLRDSVEDVLNLLDPENKGPSTKKPTIIEEVPDGKGKPGAARGRARDA